MTATDAGASPATQAPGATPAATDTNTETPDIIRLNMGTPQAAPSNTPAGTANTDQAQAAKPADGPDAADTKNVPAGSPEALRADLAGERRARQAAETARDTASKQLADVLKVLGVNTDAPQEDPAQVAKQATSDALDARREVAVVRNAPRDARGNYAVDVTALLDSRSFMASIADVDPNDAAAIAAKIDAHTKNHPNAAPVRYGAGVGDVTATGDPGAGPVDMDALIRGR